MKKIVGIRFKTAGKVYNFDSGAFVLNRGDHVIVETEQGLGFGTVVSPPKSFEERTGGRPLKKVFRLATEKDFNQRQKNLSDETSAHPFVLDWIRKLGLKKNLVSVDKSFDGNKYTFFSQPRGGLIFGSLSKCWSKNWVSELKCGRWALETKRRCAVVSAAAAANCVVRHF